MDIIAKLSPLYTDLIKIGLAEFMAKPEFNRITNHLGLTDVYARAHNESNKKENSKYDWMGLLENSNDDILGFFLNFLYEDDLDTFSEKLAGLLENAIPHLGFLPDIDDIVNDLSSIGIEKRFLDRISKAWKIIDDDYVRKVLAFQSLVIRRAYNNFIDDGHYFKLRQDMLKHPVLEPHVPSIIRDFPEVQGFWQYIKTQGGYRQREYHIQEEFLALINASKNILNVAGERIMTQVHDNIDMNYISNDWRKALNRLKDDPEAAITSARTLAETVCKHILDCSKVEYDDTIDLLKLYKLTAKQLNLSPDMHTEPIFKQILSGCFSIIDGLGSLRNKHSDAHGLKANKVKPSIRHAELAVNVSGSICSFLLQTFEYRQSTADTG